jgi:integrase
MASIRFTDVQARPTEFLDFTSVTLDEFQQLVPPFEAAYQAHLAAWRLDGKPRTARRFTVYKNCPLPTPEDRLFFILTYLKTYALIKERAACHVPRSFRRRPSSRTARPSGAPRLRGHIGHRDLCMLTLIRNAGLHASEVLHLHVHDIGWTSSDLLVREGNAKRDRMLWLNDADLELLRSWKIRRPVTTASS